MELRMSDRAKWALSNVKEREEHPRTQKMRELRAERNIRIPASAFEDVLETTPSASTMAWSWWSHYWPFPNTHNWTGSDLALAHARESWEESQAYVKWQLEKFKEADELAAKAAEERKAEDDARAAARKEGIYAELRSDFVGDDSDWERLKDRLYDEYLMRETDQARAKERSRIWSLL